MTLKKQLLPALVISMILGGCSVPEAISQNMPFLASASGQLNGDQKIVVGDDESDVYRDVEVKYTDLGFEPAELEITTNTRVVFLNQSVDRLWVKSDQPFYSFKPKFDGKQGITSGEWLSVIFKEPGTWEYQNYLNPKQKGTITVVDMVE